MSLFIKQFFQYSCYKIFLLFPKLRKNNIGVGVHFMPVHQHLYYSETFNLRDDDFPVASSVFPRLLSLPIYPGMNDENVDRVISVLTDVIKRAKR